MKKWVLVSFTMVLSSHAQAARLDSLIKVAEDHTSVVAMVYNSTSGDVFCDTISIDVTRTGREFGDFASRAQVQSGPVYVPAGRQIDLSGLVTRAALASQGVQGVAAASVDVASCHFAKFSEYCFHSEKTAEERHTTDLILRTTRRDCGEAEAAVGHYLDLDNGNIRSLKPVGFLKHLRGLDLKRNMIEDLAPLKHLSVLAALDISRNPVRDLTPVLSLVSIRAVNARRTRVREISDPIKHLRKRGVRVKL